MSPIENGKFVPAKEFDMESDCLHRLRANGYILSRQVEIGHGGTIADLAWLDKNNEIHAAELKLANWREAFEQALNYAHDAHYTYICLPPKKRIFLKAIKECEKAGIGYLEYKYPTVVPDKHGYCTFYKYVDLSFPFIIYCEARRNDPQTPEVIRNTIMGHIKHDHEEYMRLARATCKIHGLTEAENVS